jgi:phospholipase C
VKLGRRQFLRAGGVAASGLVFPSCIRDALAIPAQNCSKSMKDVEHVVILIQENRSFDHYFGTMRGVRGFGDRFTIPIDGAPSVWHQQGESGVILPYHLDASAGNAQRVDGAPHGYLDGHYAWDHGRLGRWPSYKQPQSMGYYTEAELPFQFALAEAFTVCDAYFASMHAGTNPNRLYAFTGTIDPHRTNGGPAIDNSHDTLGDPEDGYTWTTYAERLEAAGVSWCLYQDFEDNFTDNPLVGFRTFRDAYRNDPSSPLAQKGLGSKLSNATLDGFRDDVVAGRLPSVSWIVGPAAYSEHPGPSSPVQGAYYVQQVLEALVASPDVFRKTALIVTFDENDGFFDHAPSPCAPSRDSSGRLMGASTVDDSGERYRDDGRGLLDGFPHGPGMRVPTWIISPWTRGGWVCSETFDHTSILRFLECRFGVEEPNISPFRRAMCGNLCSAFDFETPNEDLVPALPTKTRTEADTLRAEQEALPPVAVPLGDEGSVPTQAPGTRPSRALPYALDVRAEVDHEQGEVRLTFVNTGSAGAVFHVYDRYALAEIPRRYAVEPGKSLEDVWMSVDPQSRYALWVLGPNGFHREVAGAVGEGSPSAGLEVEVIYDPEGGFIGLRCKNDGAVARSFVLTHGAYSDDPPATVEVAPGDVEERRFDVSANGLWYDLAVTASDDPGFLRRVAGRMEDGNPSVSDPAT